MAGCSNLNTIEGVWGHKPVMCKSETKDTLSHYSLECQEFDTTRELIMKRFFETCGITYLDLNCCWMQKRMTNIKIGEVSCYQNLRNFGVLPHDIRSRITAYREYIFQNGDNP